LLNFRFFSFDIPGEVQQRSTIQGKCHKSCTWLGRDHEIGTSPER